MPFETLRIPYYTDGPAKGSIAAILQLNDQLRGTRDSPRPIALVRKVCELRGIKKLTHHRITGDLTWRPGVRISHSPLPPTNSYSPASPAIKTTCIRSALLSVCPSTLVVLTSGEPGRLGRANEMTLYRLLAVTTSPMERRRLGSWPRT